MFYNLGMIKIYKHNRLTWGLSRNDYDQKGTMVWGNTEGEFYQSLPENLKIKNGIDVPVVLATDKSNQAEYDAYIAKIDKVFESKVQEIIDGILKNKSTKINLHINFDWLLDFTKEELRKAVYHTLQDAIRNHWAEQKVASSFNTNQLSINNDLTNWIISAQQRNTAAWNALQNSRIDKYEIQTYGEHAKRFISNDDTTIIIQEFNYDLLGKNLGSFTVTLDQAIATLGTADKYDYIVLLDDSKITDDLIYRYEGGDIIDPANWLNVTQIEVKGESYFVYEDVVLVGSKGNKGDKGDKGDALDITGIKPDDYLEKEDATFIELDGLIAATNVDKKVSDLEAKMNAKDTEHDIKLSTNTAAIGNLELQLNAIGSTAELTTLKRDVATHNTDITTLKTTVSTEERDIRDLKANKADQSAVTSLDARLTSGLNAKATKAEVTAVDTKATKNAGDIATMKASVTSSSSLATSARAKANKNETDIVDIKSDVTGLDTLTTQHTASIQAHGTDISSLRNAASLLDLMDLSTNLPVTSAKIKAQLVSRGINTPSGDSHAGEFVLVKADPTGATYQFWLADTITAGEWKQASTTMEINLGAYQRKGKNGATGTGYAPGINMVLVGSTSDDPTWTNVKDALEAAFSFDTVDDNGKVLVIEGGKLVKKTLGMESTDIVLDKDLNDTAFAINKGDILVAGEVSTDGKVAKISATAIKPVIAETDAGGVTPVTTHANKLAYGGVNTQDIKYLDNPGEEGKVLTSKATGTPEWKSLDISKGTVVAADVNNIAMIEAVDADGGVKIGKTGITETYITTMKTDVDNLDADFTTLRTDVDDAQLDAATAQTDATQAIGDLADLKLKAFGLDDGDDLNKAGWRAVLDGQPLTSEEKAKIAKLPDDTNVELDYKQNVLSGTTLEALGINEDSTVIEVDNTKPNYILPFRKTEKDIIDGMVDMKVQPSGKKTDGTLIDQVAASTMDGTTADKTLATQGYVDKSSGVIDVSTLKGEELWKVLEVDKFYIIKTKTSTTEDAISDEKVIIEVHSKDDAAGIKFTAIALDNTFHTTAEITFAKPAVGNTTDLPEVIATEVVAAGGATETVIKNKGKVSDYIPAITTAEASNRIVRFWHEAPGPKRWTTGFAMSDRTDSLSMSQSGQYIVVAGIDKHIYVSKDYGKTFTDSYTNTSYLFVSQISNDGKYMICTGGVGEVIVSKDYGNTWNKVNAGARRISGIFISDDATKMYISSQDNKVYKSIDMGDNWNEVYDLSEQVQRMDSSSNGQYVYIAGSSKTAISKDYGVTWNIGTSISSTSSFLETSQDGKYVFVGDRKCVV